MKKYSLLLFLLVSLKINAQYYDSKDSLLPFDVLIVGEDHTEYNYTYQASFVNWLINEQSITIIGIECDKTIEHSINNYLLKGDSSFYSFPLEKRFKKDLYPIISEIRNQNISNNLQIKISCFDLPFEGKLIFYAIKDFLNRENEIYLDGYLEKVYSENDYSRTKLKELYTALFKDFLNRNAYYEKKLGEQYSYYESILESLKIALFELTDLGIYNQYKNDSIREEYIYQQILSNVLDGEKILIFFGNAHTNRKCNDNIFHNENFDSFTCKLISNEVNVISVYTEYMKRRFSILGWLLFRNKTLLPDKKKLESHFENDFLLIPSDNELIDTTAKGRFNYVNVVKGKR